jgi:formate hydrogenlyase subunit 4
VLSSLLSKLYWPTVGFFVLAVVVFGISFFVTIERSATGGFMNTGTLKSIAVLVAIIAGSIYMKQQGNTQAAHLILYVPFGLVLVSVLLFVVIAFMLGK